jgi:hypothetical protein
MDPKLFETFKWLVELATVGGAAWISLKISNEIGRLELKISERFEALNETLSDKYIDKQLAMQMIHDLERRIERLENMK